MRAAKPADDTISVGFLRALCCCRLFGMFLLSLPCKIPFIASSQSVVVYCSIFHTVPRACYSMFVLFDVICQKGIRKVDYTITELQVGELPQIPL